MFSSTPPSSSLHRTAPERQKFQHHHRWSYAHYPGVTNAGTGQDQVALWRRLWQRFMASLPKPVLMLQMAASPAAGLREQISGRVDARVMTGQCGRFPGRTKYREGSAAKPRGGMS
jgi:hypothetical protein